MKLNEAFAVAVSKFLLSKENKDNIKDKDKLKTN